MNTAMWLRWPCVGATGAASKGSSGWPLPGVRMEIAGLRYRQGDGRMAEAALLLLGGGNPFSSGVGARTGWARLAAGDGPAPPQGIFSIPVPLLTTQAAV